MRDSQPVTQRERLLDDDHYLITRTDLKGRITYANQAFVEVSGYERDELIGAPHSIVRHPDMPEAAFADLWETIQAGESWRGLVKNRCKNGDYYWVDASVTPILEDGEVQGYASVRVKATPEACERAERVYAAMRSGSQRRYTLDRGRIVRRGLLGRLRRVRVRSLQGRLVSMVLLSLVLLAAGGGLGLYGVDAAGQRTQALQRDGLEDVARLQQIDQLTTRGSQLLSNNDRMTLMDQRFEYAKRLETIIQRVQAVWTTYSERGVNQTPEAQAFGRQLETFLDDHQGKIATAFSGKEAFDAFVALRDSLQPLQKASNALGESINSLIQAKQAAAREMAGQAQAQRRQMMIVQAVLLGAGLVLLILMGVLTIRAIRRPIRESKQFTLQIAAGNLGATLPSRRNDEIGELMAMLDTMRKSLGNIVHDVDRSVAVVRPASRDIAAGNEDLSSRTEQQASSLEETASSMEEMTATV
ncbi:MAG: aerotaxis receptor, partial [Halomonadaceae bacterium T82-2]